MCDQGRSHASEPVQVPAIQLVVHPRVDEHFLLELLVGDASANAARAVRANERDLRREGHVKG
eukprot:4723380-Pleurochrysis_carterae.AAC.1